MKTKSNEQQKIVDCARRRAAKTISRSPKMETLPEEVLSELAQRQSPPRIETDDKSLYQQCQTLPEYRKGVNKLCQIFEVLRNESVDYGDDLSTSFVSFENRIAKCISECLPDCDEQTHDTDSIQELLRCYKVVGLLPHGKHCVSLFRIHLILQDNFSDSCLCKLFDLLLMIDGTKVLYF